MMSIKFMLKIYTCLGRWKGTAPPRKNISGYIRSVEIWYKNLTLKSDLNCVLKFDLIMRPKLRSNKTCLGRTQDLGKKAHSQACVKDFLWTAATCQQRPASIRLIQNMWQIYLWIASTCQLRPVATQNSHKLIINLPTKTKN